MKRYPQNRLDAQRPCIQAPVSRAEFDWLEAACKALNLNRAAVIRLGLLKLSESVNVGFPCPSTMGERRGWKQRKYRDLSSRAGEFFERRMHGEMVTAMAAEVGCAPGYMSILVREGNPERTNRTVAELVSEQRRIACERVLSDPLCGLGEAPKRIALAIIASETLQQAADACGVTRQRVEQVAVECRKLAGMTDGRRRRRRPVVSQMEQPA